MSTSRWLPDHRRAEIRSLANRSHQVVTLAAITGLVTGFAVAGFDRLVVDVIFDHVLELSPWVIAFLPGAGLLVALLIRRIAGGVSPSTSDEYLHSFHDPSYELGWRALIARTLAAIATLGLGNPMGLEGMSLYGGATLGTHLQERFPRVFRNADRRVLLVAGAAAGVAAIFKAPATGAVFALEVPYQGDLARRMLLPALVASATGYVAFAAVNGTDTLFQIESMSGLAYRDLAGAAALGIIAGLGARGFAWMIRHAKQISGSPHHLLTTIGAGVALGAMYAAGRLLTGESLIAGAGYHVLAWAQDPTRSIWVLLAILGLRCAATSATVAGGGVGGLFIPLVVGGALTGAVVGNLIDRGNANLFIVIGIAAFLGAGYRVPLAAVMFVAETTGRPSFIVPGLLAAVAGELIMGASSVTSYQVDPNETPMAAAARSPR
ncbi:MAG: putative H(+)/Cl(-) exchange transporter [Ilumatobacteraceae bacterium]|nr:putative H(+)/Cl(-) exchange transporter [Ilumatobacteraceae bacterium]